MKHSGKNLLYNIYLSYIGDTRLVASFESQQAREWTLEMFRNTKHCYDGCSLGRTAEDAEKNEQKRRAK